MTTPRLAALLSLPLASLLAGCEKPGEATISQSRVATAPRPVKVGASSSERFGTPEHMGGVPARPSPAEAPLVWETPRGWKERPIQGGPRLGSFVVGGDPDGDCSIAVAGGDVPTNVNRWRGQMGLPPLPRDRIDALPTAELLGRKAALIELEGTYSGMGGGEAKQNWALLGAMIQLGDGGMLFVKATGPKALIAAEKARFGSLLASIKLTERKSPHDDPHGPPDPHGSPDPHGPQQPPAPRPGELGYDAPEGWTLGPPAQMRLLTFKVAAASECAVSELGGDAGGLARNVNRWRGQMGQAPLADAELASLPRVKVLGAEAPLVEIAGTFTGMGGGPARPGWLMIATMAPRGGSTLFVKLTGPEAEVRAERERLVRFLGSLR